MDQKTRHVVARELPSYLVPLCFWSRQLWGRFAKSVKSIVALLPHKEEHDAIDMHLSSEWLLPVNGK